MRIAVYTPALNEEHRALRWAHCTEGADHRLVADSGSTDATVRLLRAAGVEVVPISVRPWRFDLGVNAALALLPADVDLCVALNIDEVCEPGFFDVIRRTWEEQPFHMGWVLMDGGWRSPRVHARHGCRYVSPCHETLRFYDPAEPRSVELATSVRHLPDNDKPRAHYLPLLELAVAEQPNDGRMWAYLARERMFRGDRPGTLEAVEAGMALPGWSVERAAMCRWGAWAAPTAEEFRSWIDRAREEQPGEPETWFQLARQRAGMGEWQEALDAAQRGLSCEPSTHYLADASVLAWQLWHLAAVCQWHLGRHRAARCSAQRALEGNSGLAAWFERFDASPSPAALSVGD